MTRAERWVRKTIDANASRPILVFQGVEAMADMDGNLVLCQGSNVITIGSKRMPAFVKFLREYFVRRDK